MSVEIEALKELFITKDLRGEFEKLVLRNVKYFEATMLSAETSVNRNSKLAVLFWKKDLVKKKKNFIKCWKIKIFEQFIY